MVTSCAYLRLGLLLLAAAQVKADWRSFDTQSRVNFSRADIETGFTVLTTYGRHRLTLRAYRVEPFNDSSCREYYEAEADRRCLRWASLGYPQLSAVVDPAGSQFRSQNGTHVKAFYLTRSDFHFELAVLADEQRRRLAQAVRIKYGFQPALEQFMPVPLSALECTYPLDGGNLTGRVADFDVYPLKVEFNPNSEIRRTIESDLASWRDSLNSSVQSRLDVANIRCFASAGEHKENRTFSLTAQQLVKLVMMVVGGKPKSNQKIFITQQQLEELGKYVYASQNVSELYDLSSHDFYLKFVDELRQAGVISHFVNQNISEIIPALSNYSMRCGWEIDDDGSYVPIRCSVANIVRDLRNVYHLDYENKSTSTMDILLREQEVKRMSNDALLSVERPDELYYLSVILFGSGKRYSRLRKSWAGASLRWRQKLEQLNRLGDIVWDVDLSDNTAPLYPKSVKVAQWTLLQNFYPITFKSITHRPHAPHFTQNFTVSVQLMQVRQPPSRDELMSDTDQSLMLEDLQTQNLDTRVRDLESQVAALAVQLSQFISPEANAARNFADSTQIDQLNGEISALDSRIGKIEESAKRIAEAVDNATVTMLSPEQLNDSASLVTIPTESAASNQSSSLEKAVESLLKVVVGLQEKSSTLVNRGTEPKTNELKGAMDSVKEMVDFLMKEHNSSFVAFNDHADQISSLFGNIAKLDRRFNDSYSSMAADYVLLSRNVDRLSQSTVSLTRLVNSLEWTMLQMRNNFTATQQASSTAIQRAQSAEARTEFFDSWMQNNYAVDSDTLKRIVLNEMFNSVNGMCFRNATGDVALSVTSEGECAWKCLVNKCAAFSVQPIRLGRLPLYSCVTASFMDRINIDSDRNCTAYILKGTSEKFGSFYRGYQLVDSNSIVTHSDRSLTDCIALCRNSVPCSALSYNSITRSCKLTLCGIVYVQQDSNWLTIFIEPAKLENFDVPAVGNQWALTETCDSDSNLGGETYGSYVITSLGTEYRSSGSPYLPNSTYFSGRKIAVADGNQQTTHLSIGFTWREDTSFPYSYGITIFFYSYFETLAKRGSSNNKISLVEFRTSTDKEGHIIYSSDSKQLEIELFHDTANGSVARFATTFTVGKAIQSQKWTAIAVTYDVVKKVPSVVIDGVPSKLASQALGSRFTKLKKWTQLLLGMAADGSMAFNGRMFCLKLFTQALDVSQIKAVADSCINGQVRVMP